MTPRTCSNCGAGIPAGAHANRTTCSNECKRQRERRPDRPPKRPPPKSPPANFDALGARFRKRERNIVDAWRKR